MKIFSLFLSICSYLSINAALTDIPHIALSAQASVKKQADELVMKVYVNTFAKNAEEALLENNLKMRRVIGEMLSSGLGDEDYETLQFQINPTYTPYPQHPPVDYRTSINGYEVTNGILVHTQDLENVGKLMDLAIKSGATKIADMHFGIKDPEKYRSEVLMLAAKKAMQDAQVLAKTTGVNLVRVLSINVHQISFRSPQISVACFAKMSNADASVPIEAGDVSIDASVQIIWEIK